MGDTINRILTTYLTGYGLVVETLTHNRKVCTLYKWFQWEIQLTEY